MMTSGDSPDERGSTRHLSFAACAGWVAFFGILIAVARYWHSAQMGFYEDDYTLVTRAMAATWPEVREFISSLLLGFGGQGRPLQHSLIYLLSWMAGRLGGLPQAYGLGWAILTLNAALAFGLLRRLFPTAAALAGGLAFALFGADTTQAFLYHSFGLQQSLTYLLLALHLYLADRRVLSYILILGSLLSYETAYPVFLAAPLLAAPRGKPLTREIARHAAVLGAMFVAVLALRLASGESRVAGLGFPDLLTVPLLHMLEGPVVSLGTYLYRPLQVIQALDGEMAAVLLASFVGLAAALWLARPERGVTPSDVRAALRDRSTASLSESTRRLLRLAAAGLSMVVLAYPLTFTIRAYAISGRDTRVHFAAVVGAAILWACLAELAYGLARTTMRRRLVSGILAAGLAGLVGFGFVVQHSYMRAWELQRTLWTDVVRLCPDLGDGTVILVEPSGLEDPRFIYANHWNLPRVLEQILVFPAEWQSPPRLFRLAPGWEANLVTAHGRFQLDGSTVVAPPSLYQEVDSRQVIFLETVGGALRRVGGEMVVNGIGYPIRDMPQAVQPGFAPGILFPDLIRPAEQESISP
jgi:hypothetical protein